MSSTNESGLALFDEAASAAGNFPSALRGYERSAVDDYVRSLEAALVQNRRHVAGLQSQITALQQQVDEAHDKLRSPDVDYSNLGGRASDILRLAEEQAREVLDHASVEAERLKEQARREADDARDEALRAGGDIKATGVAEIEQLRARGQEDLRGQVEKVTAESQAILAAARREAEALQRAADHEAQTLRQNAYLDTEGLRRTVEREVAETRQEIAEEKEAAIGHLRSVHDDAVAKTSALLSEATEYHRQATARLEDDIAEAARIRSEALAEAERIKVQAVKEAEDRIVAARKQAAAITDRTQQEFAWRKQQLRRETDLLGQRKQAVLNQLASLSALAEQTAHGFPDLEDLDDFEGEQSDRTITMPPSSSPALPPTQGDRGRDAGTQDDGSARDFEPEEDDRTILMPPSSSPALPPAPKARRQDESATETRVMQPVAASDRDSGAPGSQAQGSEVQRAEAQGVKGQDSSEEQDEETLEIDGDATIMVPASQLPAGTQHLKDSGSPQS